MRVQKCKLLLIHVAGNADESEVWTFVRGMKASVNKPQNNTKYIAVSSKITRHLPPASL
jgi:hypothetical protein